MSMKKNEKVFLIYKLKYFLGSSFILLILDSRAILDLMKYDANKISQLMKMLHISYQNINLIKYISIFIVDREVRRFEFKFEFKFNILYIIIYNDI